jgi:hypothetical protein
MSIQGASYSYSFLAREDGMTSDPLRRIIIGLVAVQAIRVVLSPHQEL